MHNPARFKKSRPNRNFLVYLSTPLVLELLEATFGSPPDFQHFSPDDKSLLYGETRDSVTSLWKKHVTGGEGTQFTNFRSEQIFNSVITPVQACDGARP